jgi:DeoR family transcriptional regulator of aga operon
LQPLRLSRLRAVVRTRGAVTVAEVVELFGVSPTTARRDLTALSRAPELHRVHGGVVRARDLSPAPYRHG